MRSIAGANRDAPLQRDAAVDPQRSRNRRRRARSLDDIVVQIIVDGNPPGAFDHQARVARSRGTRRARHRPRSRRRAQSGGTDSLGSVEPPACKTGWSVVPTGTLAGSVLTMIEAVRNLHELGAPLESALAAASSRRRPHGPRAPADAGRLDVGLPADIVVLVHDLEIEGVFVGGDAPVSLPERVARPRPSQARASSRRFANSPRRSLGACSSTTRSSHVSPPRRAIAVVARALRGARLFRQRGDLRCVRLRAALALDSAARLDCADLYFDATSRPLRLDGARSLAVGTDARCRRVPSAGAKARRVHGGDHERSPASEMAGEVAEAVLPLARRPRARGRRDEDVPQPTCGACPPRRAHRPVTGSALPTGIRSVARPD